MNILNQLEELAKNGFSKDDILLIITMAPDLFKVSKEQVETYFAAIELIQNYKDINAKLSSIDSSALNKKILGEISISEKKDRPVLSETKNEEPVLSDIINSKEKAKNNSENFFSGKILNNDKIIEKPDKFKLEPYAFDSLGDDSDSLGSLFPDLGEDINKPKKHN